ncbi:MAG: YraN family protein [Oscillospiraceae bacterium]|nr:YraN family protein [Oscillospiraceae bacterium]
MSRALGNWGEEVAAQYLMQHGYQIIARQYRTRQGEIDLIVQKREILAFVEVKLRKNASFAAAAEAVTKRKKERLLLAAQMYWADAAPELQPRFDVVEVYAPFGEKTRCPHIIHLENVFSL